MNILIVDDHKFLAEGLAEIIKKSKIGSVIGLVHNGADVMPFLEKEHPDIITLDIDLPNISGLDLAKSIMEKYSDIKIMVLTMHEEPAYFEKLVGIGIKGYVNKNADKDEILCAIATISAGENYYSHDIVQKFVVYQQQAKEHPAEEIRITQRERDVLKLIVDGCTTLEIGEKLFVSKNTVDTHRKNLLNKLNVKNTAELVKLALEKHLIS